MCVHACGGGCGCGCGGGGVWVGGVIGGGSGVRQYPLALLSVTGPFVSHWHNMRGLSLVSAEREDE